MLCVFSNFGAVQDVRIPCQLRRMFGFVTFASADTVKLILSKGNPHFICGARVLVKPYREKPKLVDRYISLNTYFLYQSNRGFCTLQSKFYMFSSLCWLHAGNTRKILTIRCIITHTMRILTRSFNIVSLWHLINNFDT